MEKGREYWENVYATKQPEEVSWTQDVPETSLLLIQSVNPPKNAGIIDIGGGDSKLVDYLLKNGYDNITVLDISANALNRAKQRLGDEAGKVHWLKQDIRTFKPTAKYALWHDRAAFHFLTGDLDIQAYVNTAYHAVAPGGYIVIGTFTDDGPTKCSGLPVTRYNEELLQKTFTGFSMLQCQRHVHTTPFGATQNFLFCSFKRQ